MTRILVATIVLVASLAGAHAQELTCANSGNTYQVGETACITACHQETRRLARCEAKSYGASWIYLSENCPSAGLPTPPRLADLFAAPEARVMTPIPAGRLPRAMPRQSVLDQNWLSETSTRYLVLAGVKSGGPLE